MFPLFFTILFITTHAASGHLITLYADVHKDVAFFIKTFPWIIDNIGGEISMEYHLLGSGRYSAPQMCALQQLYGNTFLQAQYLKCEAEGKPSQYCLCETGIDPTSFKYCVGAAGYYVSEAAYRFTALGVETTPVIQLESDSIVYGVDDISFLKEICTVFDDNLPRGCLKPIGHNEGFPEINALAHFDRVCSEEFPVICDNDNRHNK